MLNFLNQLAETSSTNDKLALLQANKDNNTVKTVFQLAYNPRVKFWIKKRPPVDSSSNYYALIEALDMLEKNIANRKLTGNAAIEFVSNLLKNLNEGDQEVLYRVIERDLKCGVNVKLINKVWKNLIPEYPVLLCGKFNEKTEKNIKYPAIFQCKMDSSRINLEFDGKFVSATTRNGSVLSISCFDNLQLPFADRCIIDGELMWRYPDGRVAERKVSNGYVTKAVRGTITPEEEKGLYVVVWDWIPYQDFEQEICKIPYSQRLEVVESLRDFDTDGKLEVVETEIVNSREEVMEKYQRNLDRGEEGGILKSLDGIWEAKRSKYQLKLKAEDPADLLVVGYELGTPGTQFDGMLGALICQTSCGQLEVSVGSGFKHKRGERDKPESYIGKIIEVNYNCIISSRGSDKKSLFLPIFKGIRYDKNTANSLEELS